MPNQALITALEDLREQYGQRQKASANLMAALKGTSAALTKVSRSLRDYNEQNQGSNLEAIAQAQQSVSSLRIKDEAIDPLLPDLRRELKQLTTLNTALKDALAALRAESLDVVKLGHASSALQNSKIQDAALAALLPDLAQELEEGQRSLGATFGLALRHALEAQGLELGGRPPRFELGRFEIEADFVNRHAALSYGKNLISKRIPLSVEAVLKAYQRESKAIMGRNEDGPRWMEMLYTAWETVRRKRVTTESRVPIVECYLELVLLRQAKAFRSAPTKHAFADYSRAQFAYDFNQFTSQEPPLLSKGMRAFASVATKSQTDNPERSIWIVTGSSPHDGNYFADLKFDRDE